MEGGGASNGDSLSVFASIASVLGVQGPLRFRPHGASQKAHVVLRRVIVSDDSSDNGSGRHVVRFSLYAQKRIEVKPGKEILLTVAEGVFKDQAIVLEAELTDPGDVADGKPAVEVAEEDEAPVLPPVVPPKMRRAWTRRGEEPNVIIREFFIWFYLEACRLLPLYFYSAPSSDFYWNPGAAILFFRTNSMSARTLCSCNSNKQCHCFSCCSS